MSARFLILFLPFLFMLTACLGMGIQQPAPVASYGQKNGAGSAGTHNVMRGDTLYSIARRYRLPMRDIAVVNRLRAPFVLHEGQRLKLPPPQVYKVQSGDTLYRVSRIFGVNSSEISRLNNIKPPYTIRVGQVLRLPSVTRKTKSALSSSSSSPSSSGGIQRQSLPPPSGSTAQGNASTPAKIASSTKPPMTVASKPRSGSSSIKTATPKRASSKFLRPVNGRILSNYGVKKNGLHNDGINISAPKGTPIRAAENGVVVYAGNELKGSGNLVLIRHENQWMTAYAHMDRISIKKGAVVRRGQSIGTVGTTGSVSKPQLHFEVRRGTEAINPKKYLGN
jgi:murein DD-endopeptidase MepM/ murein hydrolase activator NlpD